MPNLYSEHLSRSQCRAQAKKNIQKNIITCQNKNQKEKQLRENVLTFLVNHLFTRTNLSLVWNSSVGPFCVFFVHFSREEKGKVITRKLTVTLPAGIKCATMR